MYCGYASWSNVPWLLRGGFVRRKNRVAGGVLYGEAARGAVARRVRNFAGGRPTDVDDRTYQRIAGDCRNSRCEATRRRIARRLSHDRVSPDFIYAFAFEKTGLMVTAENRDLWTGNGIKPSATIEHEWKGIAETSIYASPCSIRPLLSHRRSRRTVVQTTHGGLTLFPCIADAFLELHLSGLHKRRIAFLRNLHQSMAEKERDLINGNAGQ